MAFLRKKREDENRYEIVQESHRFELRSRERFDRVAFAMKVLHVLQLLGLKPRGMSVVVYARSGPLELRRGRDWKNKTAARAEWAIVGVPRWASRHQIVFALAQLTTAEPSPLLLAGLLERARNS